ncbi:VOC family protein [Roseococcus sp. YIM B11640]|uniref:VOC family protein n=1 Tax=Roseococcus sp. YIM B11640 TaxID=3133973 RepID=UPI003C798D46
MGEIVTMDNPKDAVAPVKGGIAPYLMVDGAMKAAEFYKKALGAELAGAMPPDASGRTMHVHLYIHGNSLMMSDPWPEHGQPLKERHGTTLHLQLDDVDAWWKRAVDAGMTVVMPLELQFWGDRYGQLKDPFDVLWSMASRG